MLPDGHNIPERKWVWKGWSERHYLVYLHVGKSLRNHGLGLLGPQRQNKIMSVVPRLCESLQDGGTQPGQWLNVPPPASYPKCSVFLCTKRWCQIPSLQVLNNANLNPSELTMKTPSSEKGDFSPAYTGKDTLSQSFLMGTRGKGRNH